MTKRKVLEIRYGFGVAEVPYDDTEEIFAFCQDPYKGKPVIPYPESHFDVVRLNFAEPFNLVNGSNYELKDQVVSYIDYLKEGGKFEVYGFDVEAEAYMLTIFGAEHHNTIVSSLSNRNIVLSPKFVSDTLKDIGFNGPIIENRMEFPYFKVKAYPDPIKWEVSDWDEVSDKILGNYVIPSEDRKDEDWSSLLAESQQAVMPERTLKTSCCVSALCKEGQEDVLSTVLGRLVREQFDEYIILIDAVWNSRDAFYLLQDFQSKVGNTTIILSDDISGICRAWNRLFQSTRGEYIFVNSSDFMVFPGHKEKLLSHMEENEKLGWITAKPNLPAGRCYAYSSCFRASALFEVNLLSPEFNPCTCDDNDIAMKLNVAGYDICACYHTEAVHLANHDLGTCDRFHGITKDYNFMMNRQVNRYKQKWGDYGELMERNLSLWGAIPWCFELSQGEGV